MIVTPMQAALLQQVQSVHRRTGLWPSIAYLAKLACTSYSTMQQRVYTMEKKGWLLRSKPGIGDLDPRGVRLVADADFSLVQVQGGPPAGSPSADSVGGVAGNSKRLKKAGKAGVQKRPCLCCGEIFASEGKHNRICTPCKESDFWRIGSDTVPYTVQIAQGAGRRGLA